MKINNKILYIPPFISTTWNHIQALYLKESRLIVSLVNDTIVEIPDLKPDCLDMIFAAHANFLEEQANVQGHAHPSQITNVKSVPFLNTLNPINENDSSLTFGFGTFDSFGSALQHNENQSNMPDLPAEILSKISAIAKIIVPEDVQNLPKPELHCNCVHCQIARAVHNGVDKEPYKAIQQTTSIEDEVSDADLNFQQWDIKQLGEKLFSVSHRLDAQDKYNVYLGHPIGCTCGKQGCEHILAVLKS